MGAGPAGVLLSHPHARGGVEWVVVENRSRDHVEHRQRAGLLEHGSVQLLRESGLGARLDAEGIEHGGIYLQFDGARHHLDFRALVDRSVTIYAQTEVVKDLVATRLAGGQDISFEVSATEVADLDTERPVLRWVDADGHPQEVACAAIAGCDGFHGVCRPSIPASARREYQRDYPFAWLGIIAEVPPSTDELIYAHHPDGFALHSVRSPYVSRLYLQVGPDEDIGAWPDERIWAGLQRRFALPGWTLREGPVREKAVTPMRSFVSTPMRYGRLFLAGDAAHIVPPTGAKGLNLALADVAVLAEALTALLRDGDARLADAYSDTCLARVWRATYFSSWMTSMLHPVPGDDFGAHVQIAQLRHVTSSPHAAAALAENYAGLPLPRGGQAEPGFGTMG